MPARTRPIGGLLYFSIRHRELRRAANAVNLTDRPGQAMGDERERPTRCCLGLEWFATRKIADGEASEGGEWPRPPREAHAINRCIEDWRQPAPRRVGECEPPPSLRQPRVVRPEHGPSDRKEGCAALADRRRVAHFVEQSSPTLGEAGQLRARDPAREQFARGRLQSWFGGRRGRIEALKRVAPPRQPDGA